MYAGMRSIVLAVFADDVHLDADAVHELVGVLVVGQEQAPDAELVAHQRVAEAVPVVEVADEAKLQRGRGPLAVPDAGLAVELAAVEAEVVVPLADRPEQPAGLIDAVHGCGSRRIARGAGRSTGRASDRARPGPCRRCVSEPAATCR